MDKNSLFRKSSVDRISSPEQLSDYLKVTNPAGWIILAAVALLLIGFFVWVCAGTIKTEITSENGTVSAEEISPIELLFE